MNPDWDAELEELVKEVEAEEASTSADFTSPEGAAEVLDPAQDQPAADKDLAELLAERTLDLQRVQAEYVNYRRRVERDRDQARQRGIESVVSDLLPVLDGIDAARAHDELTGGAEMIADELQKVATKYGLTAFGEVGDPFDPHIHEALMHMDVPGYAVPSVAAVFQKGYALGERVIRPTRVGVTDGDGTTPDAAPADPPAGEAPEPPYTMD
jgi:molecular chaperone GrpE